MLGNKLATLVTAALFGAAMALFLGQGPAHAAGSALPLLQLGLPDRFVEHGDPAKLLAGLGLDAQGIERSIAERFANLLPIAASAGKTRAGAA